MPHGIVKDLTKIKELTHSKFKSAKSLGRSNSTSNRRLGSFTILQTVFVTSSRELNFKHNLKIDDKVRGEKKEASE